MLEIEFALITLENSEQHVLALAQTHIYSHTQTDARAHNVSCSINGCQVM